MKRMSRYLNILAVLGVLSVGAQPAHAALQRFSPNGMLDANTPATFAEGGMPTWFQGQDGIAVQPCITNLANCGLGIFTGEGTFNGTLPMVFQNNFPPEGFYFMAVTNPTLITGTTTVVDVEAALEFVTINQLGDPVDPPGGTGLGVFQRLRVIIAPLASLNGTWTIDHPWGTTTVDGATACQPNAGGCRITIDVPAAMIPGNFTPALGLTPVPANLFTMDTFLKSTAAPVGFLGDSVTPATFTGGTVRNFFQVSGPIGSTPQMTLAVITGQTVGLELTPQGAIDFGKVKPAGPVARTINVINLANSAFTPVITATVPGTADASPDFTVAPSAVNGCPTGVDTLAVSANCDFDVTFAPVGADGPRSATVTVSGTAVPPVSTTVNGTVDGTAPVAAVTTIDRITNQTTQTISGTLSEAGAVQVSVDGGAPVDIPVTGGTWSFNVPALTVQTPELPLPHTILITANDVALPVPGNLAQALNETIVVDQTFPVVTATIAPTVTVTQPTPATLTPANPTLTFNVIDANPGTTIVTLNGNPVNPGPVSPASLGPLADGDYTVVVRHTDAATNAASATNSFTVDGTAPAIVIASPVIGATAGRIGVTSPLLTFPVTDAHPDPTLTTVTLDGVPLVNPVSGVTTLGPFVPGEQHTLTVSATDLVGNVSTSTMTFSLLLADGAVTTLGASAPTIDDVILALKVVIGGFPETANITVGSDRFKHADVAPIGAPDGEIRLNDVLAILKKVAGKITF